MEGVSPYRCDSIDDHRQEGIFMKTGFDGSYNSLSLKSTNGAPNSPSSLCLTLSGSPNNVQRICVGAPSSLRNSAIPNPNNRLPTTPSRKLAKTIQLKVCRKRQKKRSFKLIVSPVDIWGKFPTPLDQKLMVSGDFSSWLQTAHRWFQPELVHRIVDAGMEPGLQYMYQTWIDGRHLHELNAEIADYIRDVDVLDVVPAHHGPTHRMIQLDNPSTMPVFIHGNAMMTAAQTATVPTLSVYYDTNVTQNQLRVAMNDAACHLWGYTRQQWDLHQVHNVHDSAVQERVVPFFFSLFAPSAMYTIVSLNLAIFFLNCKYATFRCHIIRIDGNIIPMHCTFTTFQHSKFTHVSQFSFTELKDPNLDESAAVPAHTIHDIRDLMQFELPWLDLQLPDIDISNITK